MTIVRSDREINWLLGCTVKRSHLAFLVGNQRVDDHFLDQIFAQLESLELIGNAEEMIEDRVDQNKLNESRVCNFYLQISADYLVGLKDRKIFLKEKSPFTLVTVVILEGK